MGIDTIVGAALTVRLKDTVAVVLSGAGMVAVYSLGVSSSRFSLRSTVTLSVPSTRATAPATSQLTVQAMLYATPPMFTAFTTS